MLESELEKYLITRVKERGGVIRKVRWIGTRGAPDRLVLFPSNGKAAFIELKAPRKRPTKLQVIEMQTLAASGLLVYLADSHKKIDDILESIAS